MPEYLYRNEKTGETISVIQRMSEEHRYFDEKGVEWKREFSVPNAAIDTKIDIFSSKDFADKTGKKKGTVGDLFDQSREASEKREKVMGKDKVKDAYWKNWSKRRGGRRPPSQLPSVLEV